MEPTTTDTTTTRPLGEVLAELVATLTKGQGLAGIWLYAQTPTHIVAGGLCRDGSTSPSVRTFNTHPTPEAAIRDLHRAVTAGA